MESTDPAFRARERHTDLHGDLHGTRFLSNGRYALLIDGAGGGFSAHGGYALTRWMPDPVRARHGLWLYLRDLDTGGFWSAGHAPVRAQADHYAVRLADASVTIERLDRGISTRIEVCVAGDVDAELRRMTLANRSGRTRRVEVTSYAEVALNAPLADAAHPAFSKLFVQTEHVAELGTLLAWRRARSAGDRPLWLAHRLVRYDGGAAATSHETDRARFLGRGRSLAAPAALTERAPLSGTVGAVLDPVLALRSVVVLEPDEQHVLTLVLAAGMDRPSTLASIERFTSGTHIEAELAAPTSTGAGDAEGLLGVPNGWLRQLSFTSGSYSVVREGTAATSTRSADPAMALPRHHTDRESGGGPPANRKRDADGARSTADPHPAGLPRPHAAGPGREELLFFNGHGGFSADGSEYVIRLEASDDAPRRPPLPWVNVIANAAAGAIVSESGSCHTWAANSRENRLTPWSNDPISDPHGEACYVRDDESAAVWSPTPGPVPGAGRYEVRHGFGYTRFLHRHADLFHETTVFVPRDDPLRIVRVRITNEGSDERRLSIYGYAELVLGSVAADTRPHVVTTLEPATGTILARNAERGEYSARVAFASVIGSGGERFATADRTDFLGSDGGVEAPAAVAAGSPLDGAVGSGLDPCAALQYRVSVSPGESVTCAFLLGEADNAAAAGACLHRYSTVQEVDRACDAAVDGWRRLLSAVRVETPLPALDVMVNGWLAYQNLSCRMFGRSAFYQSGGAFGFRDQLQDSSALLYLDPAITRSQILLHAAHQFPEGDVLHWWHPPTSKGIRTRFADDLLWLPYVASFYARSTGDTSVLDERVTFVTARALEPGEDEAFVVPERIGPAVTVHEHCCRAIDRSLAVGAHGLPLMGTGDWNDGMNRVGREGRGESVWLGFFLYEILGDFVQLCDAREERERAERYAEQRERLHAALNRAGWDGAWYRRAFYDDGTPLGSAANDECRIDALAQAWAVLSGVAPVDRAAQALDAMEEQLVSQDDAIIRLLAPPFDRTAHDPGYIKGYLPGVRENGGQYTHAAAWAVRALAELGRTERAAALLEMLLPTTHARTPADVAVYRTEPYVVAADVYGVPPHVGRGGWTWYTGSAGWLYRVALESILGVTLYGGDKLLIRPCIPASWPGFRIELRLPDGSTRYRIVVEQGATGPTEARADGVLLSADDGVVVVPLVRDGGVHDISVALGDDAGPRYRPRPPSSSDAPFVRMTSE